MKDREEDMERGCKIDGEGGCEQMARRAEEGREEGREGREEGREGREEGREGKKQDR